MHLIIDATTTQDQLKHNGIGQYTKNLTNELIKISEFEGFKISLLLFNESSTLNTGSLQKKENVFIQNIGKKRLSNFLNNIWYKTQIKPGLLKILNKFPHDNFVYFCPYFWRNFPTELAPSIPIALAFHDFALPEFNIYSTKSPVHNQIRKLQYWQTLNKAVETDAILACSNYTKKIFEKYYPQYPSKQIHTVHLGVKLEKNRNKKAVNKYIPKDWNKRGYFIYLGGTPAENKNTKGVINSYNEFLKLTKSKLKEAPYLVIAGKDFTDSKNTKIYELITKYNIDQNVKFTGFYENKDKYPLLHNSLAFLHLSLYEGFGIAVAEAMKSETAIIVHNGTSYPEVVGNAGILVNGRKPEKVGQNLMKIYQNKELRNNLAKKAKQRAQNFKWKKTARQSLEIFKKIDYKIY